MAATNHPKPQAGMPAWAARGKMRLANVRGGPAETAGMLLRGEWDYSPETLLSACGYNAGLADELAARKINAAELTWSAGFSHEGDRAQWECARRLLPLLKKKKIKALARISLARCFAGEMFKREPQAALWLERDAAGQPVSQFQGRALRMSLQNAGWRQYVAHKVGAAVEAGFSGLCFEDAEGAKEETAEFIRGLRAAARGRQALDEGELLFCAEAPPLSPVNETCNFKILRLPLRPGPAPTGGFNSNLSFLKLAFEDGGREKIYSAEFCADGLSPKDKALAASEILASGGICAALHSPAEYAQFQGQNPSLFGPADPINSTGLLVDTADCCAGPELLTRMNIQYDLIPAFQFRNFEFRKYKLLSALHLASVEAPLLEALNIFVKENQGTLLISSRHRDRFGLNGGGEERAEDNMGAGRIISYRADGNEWPPELYQKSIAPDIAKFGPQSLVVEAPEGVLALLWGKGTSRWVHVLNYTGAPAAATISLPECGGRKLQIFSPDQRQPALKILETGSAKTTFSLAELDTYCVVEIK